MVEKQLNAINVLHQGSSKAKSWTGFGLATNIDQHASHFNLVRGKKQLLNSARNQRNCWSAHLFQVIMEVFSLQGVSKLNLDNAETWQFQRFVYM